MLELRDIHKRFGNQAAVDGLSLRVERGACFGLLGPNGAGKTTSIRIGVGLLAPDAGEVIVDGRGAPSDPDVRRCIGLAPQSLAIYDDLSARENLAFFGTLYGLTRPEARRRADELLERVGLSERGTDRAGTFSGGMKRRLNLACALVHAPTLLLLDEPTVGVDPQSRNAIFELVREIRAEGVTVVYTTHYMEEAQKLCDTVAIVDHGRVIALGGVDALLSEHGGDSVVRVSSGEDVREVATRDPMPELAKAMSDPATTSLEIKPPDLERVFLNLTGRSLRD
ncbi:MAG: linearmycin resistance ATP-binding protein LnrL [Phycisphaerales bacterium]